MIAMANREKEIEMKFSEETVLKAHRLIDEGRVVPDENLQGVWHVKGFTNPDKLYRVQSDYSPVTRSLTWITCTCPHGLNAGAGATRCYHAAAVLLILREAARVNDAMAASATESHDTAEASYIEERS